MYQLEALLSFVGAILDQTAEQARSLCALYIILISLHALKSLRRLLRDFSETKKVSGDF